jgi:hypothetical protein
MMTSYYRFSFALSIAMCTLPFVAIFSMPHYAMTDGNGPGADALAFLAALVLAGISLAHSLLVTILYAKTHPGKAQAGKIFHGIVAAILLLYWVVTEVVPAIDIKIAHLIYDYSPSRKHRDALLEAAENSPLKNFTEVFARREISGKDADEFRNKLIDTAAAHQRLDILKFLKEKGVPVAGKDQAAWIAHVAAATNRTALPYYSPVKPGPYSHASPLSTVQWLLDEGASYHYRLANGSRNFFDQSSWLFKPSFQDGAVDNCSTSAHLESPENIALYSQLVNHGADVHACGEAYDNCGMALAIQKNCVAQLEFMLARGIRLDKNPDGREMFAFREAIANGHIGIVKALLKTEPNPGSLIDSWKLKSACYNALHDDDGNRKALLLLLRDAHAVSATQIAESGLELDLKSGCLKLFRSTKQTAMQKSSERIHQN